MTIQVVNVKRARKSEAEQAVSDLIDRGYTVVYPLTEKKREGKSYMPGENGHVKFVDNVLSGQWVAQMKRVVE